MMRIYTHFNYETGEPVYVDVPQKRIDGVKIGRAHV